MTKKPTCMNRGSRTLGRAGVALLLCSSWALAQLTTGTITGTVEDSSGAAVPGTSITVKNLDTGVSRATITGPRGRYEVPNLQVGNYEVTATMAGFQTSVRSGIQLTVGRIAVVDHALQIGEVTQAVTVTGEASLVETTTATVTQLVDEKRVEELPLRDRDLTQLAFLQPGVIKSPAGRGVFGGMGDKMIIAGARGTQNLFLLDGVSNTDLSNNPQGASGTYTGAETVKEFQIITNNYSAEYQSAAGGIVSAVTKSGTNTLHGSGFWTLRNDNLDANSFGNNRQGLNKREFKRNQFGGSLGGPVIRDKAFFFGSYEGFRERDTDADTVNVWSEAQRAGLLAPADPNCNPSRGPGCSADRRSVTVDPVIRQYMDLWPRPNTPYRFANNEAFPICATCPNGGLNPNGTVTLLGGGWDQDPVNEDFVGAKLDYQFAREKMGFLSGSYNWSDSDQLPIGIMTEVGAGGRGTTSRKHTLGVGHTSVLSPSMVNEFKFGYSWSELFGDLPRNQESEFSDLAHLSGRKLIGQINAPFVTGVGWRVNFSKYLQKAYQFREGLSITSGNHSYRMGTEIKLFRYLQDSCSRGCNGVWTWRDFPTFLQNRPRRLEIFQPGHDNPERNLKQLLFGAYFQDNWQVASSLTLNLGARWEFTTVPAEENNLIATLRNFHDRCVTVSQEVKDDPRYKNDCFEAGTIDQFFTNPTLKSISPRVGFAWAPGAKKFAIRGGAGIFYEYPMLYNIRTVLQESPPFVLTGRIEDSGASGAGLTLTMRPGIGSDPAFVPLLASTPNVRAMEYDQKNVTVYRWSLTLQQELPASFVVSAGYTGSRGTHLWHQSIANINKWVGWPAEPTGLKTFPQPNTPEFRALTSSVVCGGGVTSTNNLINPCFGEMRIQSPNADSYFHGLAVGVQKRLSQGFQMQLAYNYAKSIDTGSGVTSGGDELPQGQRGIYFWDMQMKRGLSQFDMRNSLTANFTYELPTQNLTGPLGWVIGGWQVNGIITLLDGHPLSTSDNSSLQDTWINDNESLRLNLIPGGDNNPVVDARDPFRYYDATQFVPSFCTGFGAAYQGKSVTQVVQESLAANRPIPPICSAGDAQYFPGHFGNTGRNTLTSPGDATVDFSIQKNFRIGETHRIQFRAEFFNLFNRANYSDPDESPFNSDGIPDPAFWVTSGQIDEAGTPRTIQLGLKYTF